MFSKLDSTNIENALAYCNQAQVTPNVNTACTKLAEVAREILKNLPASSLNSCPSNISSPLITSIGLTLAIGVGSILIYKVYNAWNEKKVINEENSKIGNGAYYGQH